MDASGVFGFGGRTIFWCVYVGYGRTIPSSGLECEPILTTTKNKECYWETS